MAATKRQMNWAPVTFTPSGGTAMTATGVTNVSVTAGGSLVKFAGDGDHYNTTVVNDMNDPSIKITTADEAWAMGIAPGTRGTLVVTHKDAKLGTGGNITFTLSNAVAMDPTAGGQHKQIGSSDITFFAESTDGVTSPLSFSLA